MSKIRDLFKKKPKLDFSAGSGETKHTSASSHSVPETNIKSDDSEDDFQILDADVNTGRRQPTLQQFRPGVRGQELDADQAVDRKRSEEQNRLERLNKILCDNGIECKDLGVEEKEQICNALEESMKEAGMTTGDMSCNKQDEARVEGEDVQSSQDLFQSQSESAVSSQASEKVENCAGAVEQSTDECSSQNTESCLPSGCAKKRKLKEDDILGDKSTKAPRKSEQTGSSVQPSVLRLRSLRKAKPDLEDGEILINKKRRKCCFIHQHADVFQPRGDVDLDEATQRIVQFFEVYRTCLRDTQTRLPTELAWGKPVVAGRHCVNTLMAYNREYSNFDYVAELMAVYEASSQSQTLPDVVDDGVEEESSARISPSNKDSVESTRCKRLRNMETRTTVEKMSQEEDVGDDNFVFEIPTLSRAKKRRAGEDKPIGNTRERSSIGVKSNCDTTAVGHDNDENDNLISNSVLDAPEQNVDKVKGGSADEYDRTEEIRRRKLGQHVGLKKEEAVTGDEDETQLYCVEELEETNDARHVEKQQEVKEDSKTKKCRTARIVASRVRSRLPRQAKEKKMDKQSENISKYFVENDNQVPASDDDDDVMVVFDSGSEKTPVKPANQHANRNRERIESDDLNLSVGSRVTKRLFDVQVRQTKRRGARPLPSSQEEEDEEPVPGYEKCPKCQAYFTTAKIDSHVYQCGQHGHVGVTDGAPQLASGSMGRVQQLFNIQRNMHIDHPNSQTHMVPFETVMECCVICQQQFPAGEDFLRHVNECLDLQEAESQQQTEPPNRQMRNRSRHGQGVAEGICLSEKIGYSSRENENILVRTSEISSPETSDSDESACYTDTDEETTLSAYLSKSKRSKYLQETADDKDANGNRINWQEISSSPIRSFKSLSEIQNSTGIDYKNQFRKGELRDVRRTIRSKKKTGRKRKRKSRKKSTGRQNKEKSVVAKKVHIC